MGITFASSEDFPTFLHHYMSTKKSVPLNRGNGGSFREAQKGLCHSTCRGIPWLSQTFHSRDCCIEAGCWCSPCTEGVRQKVPPYSTWSRTMTQVERNYDSRWRKYLPVVFALQHLRVFLISTEPFSLISVHNSSKVAFKKKGLHGCLVRLLRFLSEYDFVIQWQPENENIPYTYCHERT